MQSIKESDFSGVHVTVAKDFDVIPLLESSLLNRQGLRKQDLSSGKETGKPTFINNMKVVSATAPIHVPDLSEVSYSDFILYNYGQAYQKQYNPPGTDKLRKL